MDHILAPYQAFQFNEEKALTAKKFFSVYKNQFPMMAVFTEGFDGGTPFDCYDTYQVVRIHGYTSQPRIIALHSAENSQSNLRCLSIPRSTHVKFRAVKTDKSVGNKQDLKTLLNENRLPVLVEVVCDDNEPLWIGAQRRKAGDFGYLMLTNIYEEHFMLLHCINQKDLKISKFVNLLELSNELTLAPITGFKKQSAKKYREYLKKLEKFVEEDMVDPENRSYYDKHRGNPDFTTYDFEAVFASPSEHNTGDQDNKKTKDLEHTYLLPANTKCSSCGSLNEAGKETKVIDENVYDMLHKRASESESITRNSQTIERQDSSVYEEINFVSNPEYYESKTEHGQGQRCKSEYTNIHANISSKSHMSDIDTHCEIAKDFVILIREKDIAKHTNEASIYDSPTIDLISDEATSAAAYNLATASVREDKTYRQTSCYSFTLPQMKSKKNTQGLPYDAEANIDNASPGMRNANSEREISDVATDNDSCTYEQPINLIFKTENEYLTPVHIRKKYKQEGINKTDNATRTKSINYVAKEAEKRVSTTTTSDFTNEELCEILTSLKLSKHIDAFRNKNIQGSMVLDMSSEDLMDDFSFTRLEAFKLLMRLKTGRITN